MPSPRFVTLCAPSGPSGKQTTSPGASSCSPSGSRRVGVPRQHEQPLLVAVLVVVRADALARGELVDRARRAPRRRSAGRCAPYGVAVARAGRRRPRLDLDVVDGVTRPPRSRPRRPGGRSSAGGRAPTLPLSGYSTVSGDRFAERMSTVPGPAHLVRAVGPRREADDVAVPQLALAVRVRSAGDPETTSSHSSMPWWKWYG